jgi:hypothetical protein
MVSASTSYLEVMVLMLLFRFLAPSSLSLRSAPALCRSDAVRQNEYMEEHRKRYGRRFDHEERK